MISEKDGWLVRRAFRNFDHLVSAASDHAAVTVQVLVVMPMCGFLLMTVVVFNNVAARTYSRREVS